MVKGGSTAFTAWPVVARWSGGRGVVTLGRTSKMPPTGAWQLRSTESASLVGGTDES